MSRRVLLVDTDVDALGALASALRSRGMIVANASEVFDAVEIAFQTRPDVVIVANALDKDGELTDALSVVPELAKTPVLRLHDTQPPELFDEVVPASMPDPTWSTSEAGRASDPLDAGWELVADDDLTIVPSEDDPAPTSLGSPLPPIDLEPLIARIVQASPRENQSPPLQELRGNVEQMPLVDLLQLLTMNRRSGFLRVTTASGAGEVRLAEGEVTEALFRKLDGEKAFYRLLGQKEGHFAFIPGPVLAPGRIGSSTSGLLMEAMRQVDEVGRRRAELAPAGEALLLHDKSAEMSGTAPDREVPSGSMPPLLHRLTELLTSPQTLDEILDEIAAPDLEILEGLVELRRRGRVRRVPWSSLTTPLCTPEQLPMLRSIVTRLTRAGFALPPRLVIASSARRIPALAHAVRRIMDATVPTDPPASSPVGAPLGVLRLGDGIELGLIGLASDDSIVPTWSFVLAGAVAAVRMNEAGGEALDEVCQALEVTLVDAESVMGELDFADPEQVAALVRSALELASSV